MRGRRYDAGEISGPEMTPEGYLRCWATIARTGIQKYKRADGSEVLEYRPASEVGRVDSLASFAGKAVTLEHPPELLTSENTAKYQVGFTDSEVVFDGAYVKVRMTITRQDAIDSVLNGQTRDTSAGYEVDLIQEPGFDDAVGRFDAKQTNIEGNHVAITKRGRAGVSRVHLDSDDAVAVATPTDNPAKINMAQINIAGAMYEVSEAVAAAYTSAQQAQASEFQTKLDTADTEKRVLTAERDQLQAQLAAANGTVDELRPRVDSLSTELTEAKTALEQAEKARTDSAEQDIDALVEARLELRNLAAPHLDSDFDFTGKSEREIKEAVLKQVHGDSLDLSERDDVYVAARFDALVELADVVDSSAALRSRIASAQRSDNSDATSRRDSKREKNRERLENAWKQTPTKGAN